MKAVFTLIALTFSALTFAQNFPALESDLKPTCFSAFERSGSGIRGYIKQSCLKEITNYIPGFKFKVTEMGYDPGHGGHAPPTPNSSVVVDLEVESYVP